MYQALYRKWRPQVFADVIGQSHITRTLKRQAAENRTSHAYLFTGTRGTGKTTCAKILARAVNCENPSDGDPCGSCPACVGIADGSYMDVLELDAASNNGVDQVRALRDEAVYAPVNVKKRVYIIDEVHMLSTPAFNALLKILEEPPDHLMFILATTELHKVPATILSRCQRYAFKRIQPKDIQARLSYVAEREGLELSPDGAELLSRLADGALRDGLSLLDQCAAVGGKIDAAAVLDILGLAGRLQTAQLLEYVLRRDVEHALGLFGELYDGGRDAGTILGELSDLIRDLLLRQMAPEGSAALLSGGYDAATLDRLETYAAPHRFLYLAQTVQRSRGELFTGGGQRLQAEMCLLRLCDETLERGPEALLSRLEHVEELLSGIDAGQVTSMPLSNASMNPPSSNASVNPPPSNASVNPPTVPVSVPKPPQSTVVNPDILAANPPQHSAADTAPWDSVETTPEIGTPVSDAFLASQTVSNAAIPSEGVPMDAPRNIPASSDWPVLLERCQARLPGMYRSFLGQCTGVSDGDTLIIYGDDVLLGRLDNDRVRTALLEESHAARLIMRPGEPPHTSPEENLKQLLAFSSQHDIITIKGNTP